MFKINWNYIKMKGCLRASMKPQTIILGPSLSAPRFVKRGASGTLDTESGRVNFN